MKNAKMSAKATAIVLIFAVAILSLACLCACDANLPEAGEKTISVAIGDATFTETTDALYLHDALKEMFDEGDITVYDYTDGAYGAMVNAVGTLVPNTSANEFVALYIATDDVTLYNDSWGAPIELDGQTYHTAVSGVSTLAITDGGKYLLAISSY